MAWGLLLMGWMSPFPAALCVLTGFLLHSSQPHLKFFCATPRVTRWIQTYTNTCMHKQTQTVFYVMQNYNTWFIEMREQTVRRKCWGGERNWRLIVDRVHRFLYRVCFSASRASFIRQQIQPDVWIRTTFRRRDQIPANKHIHRNMNTFILKMSFRGISQEHQKSYVTYLQLCTTTISLFLWGLCLMVNWISPKGAKPGEAPL